MYYTHADLISTGELKENIKVRFYGLQYFRTSTDESFSTDTLISL